MRVSKRWKILSTDLEKSWTRLSKDLEAEKKNKKKEEKTDLFFYSFLGGHLYGTKAKELKLLLNIKREKKLINDNNTSTPW